MAVAAAEKQLAAIRGEESRLRPLCEAAQSQAAATASVR
jgi:hypothetical protein